MAQNEVYRVGQYIPAPVPNGTPAGVAQRVGALNFITVTPEGLDGNYEGQASADLGGAHNVPVTVAGAPLAFGGKVYIQADGDLTNVATDATWWGTYIEPLPTPVGANVSCVVKVESATV